MTSTGWFGSFGIGLLAFALLTETQGLAQSGPVQVLGGKGTVTYSVGRAAPVQIQKGISVPAGAIIRTFRGGAVDLNFGSEVGTVRLTQNSVLSLDKVERNQTMLTLAEGSMVGWNANVPNSSEYQVKLPNGIAGIVNGHYRLDARSYLVVLKGAMVYAYVPPGGEPIPSILKAPPAVYFSPLEGVKPAPAELQREVELQSKGKLR